MRHALFALSMVLLPATVSAQPQPGPAERATQEALERIETLEPRVNAIIALNPTALDQARVLDRQRRARGPLFGMPILLKDNIEARGPLPTTAGSLALRNNVTNRDAPLVAGLRAAGAVIIGKANLSEWANIRSNNSISGWSATGGQTRNPHALDRNPCGSSSGSGAAVAAGMVPAAIGTETNGSVTCPAAINGIVGFKPTVGLVSRTHIVPISPVQDTAGPMTRTVRDAALVLTAMAGSDPADPATVEADSRREDYAAALDANALNGARIGVMRFASGFGTDERFAEALAVLRRQGAQLVEIEDAPTGRVPGKDGGEEAGLREILGGRQLMILLAELRSALDAYLATTDPEAVPTRTLADIVAFNAAHADKELTLFGQDLFEQALEGPQIDSEDYIEARALSDRLAGPEGIDALLAEHDVVALVGPTMPAAWPIDAVHGDQISGGGAGGLAAIAGYPHLTVPMGAVRGLPVGLSFIGAKWDDARILSLGYAYEQASQARVEPRFVSSIEETQETLEAFAPQTLDD